MKFCWNCGHKNDNNSIFCEDCGTDLREGVEETEIVSQETSVQPVVSEIETHSTVNTTNEIPISLKKKMSNGKKAGLIFLGLCLLAMVGAYFYGNYYFSFDQQVNRMQDTIKSKDPKKWNEIIISDDPSYEVTADNLKKMTDYYSDETHKESFSDLVNSLEKRNKDNKDLSIVPNGKYYFLFDKYSLEIQPVYLAVETQQPGVIVEVDGVKQKESKDEEIKIGPLTPGVYEVKGSLKNVSTSSKVDLMRFKNDEFDVNSQLTFDLHKISFQVTSNVDDADVYVDEKKVGTIKDGSAEIKDLVWHQGLSVQVKKTLDKQDLESEVVIINSDEFLADDYSKDGYYSEISLNFDDIKIKQDLSYFLDRFYSSVSYYTNDYATMGILEKSEFANYFSKGEENAEYHDFIKFIDDIRTSDEKSYVSGTPQIESFTMIGKDTYQAVYLIEYRTVYDSYRVDDVVQVFRYKKATFTYNESESTFQVVDLGGTDNFEIVDNGGV